MNHEEWNRTKAADRIKLYDKIADAWNDQGQLKAMHINTPAHHFLLRELAFGGSTTCECCEEYVPQIMCYDGPEYDDGWKESPEADLLEDVEYSICAWCIQEKRQETECEHCGLSKWLIARGHHDEQGRYFQTAAPCTHPDGHSMKLKHPYKEASE